MAALAFTPASGSVINTVTATNVAVTAADSNTATGYNAANIPASPQVVYYIRATASGQDTLESYRFSTDSAGGHLYQDLIFPAAGSWTVTLRDDSDDSQVATAGVTVS